LIAILNPFVDSGAAGRVVVLVEVSVPHPIRLHKDLLAMQDSSVHILQS
jgi:hypothetical protein